MWIIAALDVSRMAFLLFLKLLLVLYVKRSRVSEFLDTPHAFNVSSHSHFGPILALYLVGRFVFKPVIAVLLGHGIHAFIANVDLQEKVRLLPGQCGES